MLLPLSNRLFVRSTVFLRATPLLGGKKFAVGELRLPASSRSATRSPAVPHPNLLHAVAARIPNATEISSEVTELAAQPDVFPD
ncbi:hypothetical protein X739_29950 [Mesorhizobium sp. LNHC220B00]|nr:hypothetical protein X739_29950 [Mesorhizobium sp. LNHC220B00]